MCKSNKVGQELTPDKTRNNKVSGQMVSLMADMATYIRSHANETLTLARLSREAGLSSSYFQRLFKSVIGVSPKEFQATCKEKLFREKLQNGEDVLSATLDSGYGSTSRIYEHVDGSLGMTPATYRAGGKGEDISYASRNTDFGLLMMAATKRGVCFVQFGETNEKLLQNLRAEFPNAILSETQESSESALNDWMTALANHLDRSAPLPELPLDIRGTAFQVKVWKFLLSVKPGDVVSYTEVATGIGSPKSVRAAANACGSNRIAVLIPCHRVLRADGRLGGYRWGNERKRVLLDNERSAKACDKL
ncbi:MAG: methylated-DNA--[protein]-cysteine S-methyltransferase [Alteromonas stellipolaris]|uniref:bifunctional transcriptional activator/DNA repair enzyme AdaA n=1 Tax=Alteromonas stellipolaris TaxID=233316 RepID=UPI003B8BD63B